MLRRALLCLLLPAALALSSCGYCGAEPGSAAAVERDLLSPAERATLQAIDAIGDGPALVVLVRPDRWSKLHDQLVARAGGLHELLPEELRAALATPEGLLSFVLTRADLPAPPLTLDGLDWSRPVVIGLADAPLHGPRGAGAVELSVQSDSFPGLRHVALVPAAYPDLLMTSLATALDRLGRRDEGRWTIGAETQVTLTALPDAVRVSVVHGGVAGAGEPELRPPVHTPALLAAARDDATIVAVARPWRLRALASWTGGYQIRAALDDVSAEYREQLAAKGLSILLHSELLMADDGAESDDLSIALVHDDASLRVRGVSSLTEHGAAIYDRALAQPGPLVSLGEGVTPIVDVRLAIDLGAMLEAASELPELAAMPDASALAEAVMECGSFCSLYLGARAPIGFARTVERFGGAALGPKQSLRPWLPTSARAVLVNIAGTRLEGAIAATVAKDLDLTPLRALISKANARRSSPFKLELATATRGEQTVVMLGVNVDPATVFDPEQAGASSQALASVDVDLKPIVAAAERLGGGGEQLAALRQLSAVSLASWRSGRAVVGELAIGGAPLAEAPAPWISSIGQVTWPSPLRDHAGSPGDACLADAARGIANALDAIVAAAPEHHGALLTTALGEVEGALACASEHEGTRAAAADLRRAVVMSAARWLTQTWRSDQAATLLAAQCELSRDEALCAERARLQAIPTLALPRLSVAALVCASIEAESPGRADVRVALTADGPLVVDDAATPVAELTEKLDAVAARLAEGADLLEPPVAFDGGPLTSGHHGAVELGIAADVRYSAVKPVLEAMARSKIAHFDVLVESDGGARRLPIGAPLRRSGDAAAPSGPLGERDLDAPRLVYELDGATVRARVVGGGATSPRELQAPTVEALRAQLHVLYPDAITHVDATDATPWSRVVVALAAGCPSSHLTRTAELPTGATTAIEGEAPAGGAPRSKEQIQRVIRGHLPALRACYERALLKDPDAGGRVILGLTVTPRGDVREAAIGDSEEVDAEMGACLRKEAGTMKFPASSDETTIRYPLIFESSG